MSEITKERKEELRGMLASRLDLPEWSGLAPDDIRVLLALLQAPPAAPVRVTREWIGKCVQGWMECSYPTTITELVADILQELGVTVLDGEGEKK